VPFGGSPNRALNLRSILLLATVPPRV
jgi:hypothetical protein